MRTVHILLVSLLFVAFAATSHAQGISGVAGVALPRKKTCTLEVPAGQPGAGCVVKVVARDTGTLCGEDGTKKITLSVTITCGSEVCDDYPKENNCTDNTGGFGFACGGNTITVDTSGTWTGLMGANGSCDDLSATGL